MQIVSGNGAATRHLFGYMNMSPRKKTVLSLKKANLSATRSNKIQLPIYYDDRLGKAYDFSEFVNHPSGIQSILNTNALQSVQNLDSNTYRCTLQKVKLLSFEVAPVLELRVTPTNEDCVVELLSCKFEGSNSIEDQNDKFSANMTNRMTWDDNALEVDVKLNLTLEIFSMPFLLLPTAAVETPGNLMLQTLLDKLVPSLLQQLSTDYTEWAHCQNDKS